MKPIQFFQDGPELGNQYDTDSVLKNYLKRMMPSSVLFEIEADLRNMGQRTISDILELGMEAEMNPPRCVSYEAWGRRVDKIDVSRAWRDLDRISAAEGLIAIAYERKYGQWSRIYQFAKLYLFHPSSAFYTCPLAMTDGAARVLEVCDAPELKVRAFDRFTSRNPSVFWTSGQWMTEREGGSDLSRTSTIARFKEGQWRLYGEKWFASATTAQTAMVLAQLDDPESEGLGLSLFYVEVNSSNDDLNHIQIKRLKDKMGTKALPTAELFLDGTPAIPVGGTGHGVRKISNLFNVTRVHNSVYAASYMRRGLALARDYAGKRLIQGKKLSQNSLHVEVLAELEMEFRAGFALAFRAAELLGKVEAGKDEPGESNLLRIVIPLAKLSTAKQAVSVLGEVIECFGGAGYVEDTGIPVLLRNAHVLPIWEGTTNVLSLDVLRAMLKDAALDPFLTDIRAKLASVKHTALEKSVKKIREASSRIDDLKFLQKWNITNAGTRSLAFSLARIYSGVLLLEQANWELGRGEGRAATVAAIRWCSRTLLSIQGESFDHLEDSLTLAMMKDGAV